MEPYSNLGMFSDTEKELPPKWIYNQTRNFKAHGHDRLNIRTVLGDLQQF
jgi:hypothetical protein